MSTDYFAVSRVWTHIFIPQDDAEHVESALLSRDEPSSLDDSIPVESDGSVRSAVVRAKHWCDIVLR